MRELHVKKFLLHLAQVVISMQVVILMMKMSKIRLRIFWSENIGPKDIWPTQYHVHTDMAFVQQLFAQIVSFYTMCVNKMSFGQMPFDQKMYNLK